MKKAILISTILGLLFMACKLNSPKSNSSHGFTQLKAETKKLNKVLQDFLDFKNSEADGTILADGGYAVNLGEYYYSIYAHGWDANHVINEYESLNTMEI